jgi:3',5'-nucleoside bisphosphate phosphatase
LADGAPAYVERQELPAAIALEWIKDAGGVASWAHPQWRGVSTPAGIEATVEELCSVGLAGLEANYGRYSGDERRALRRLANRHGLVATGGSDYHGTYKPDLSVGIGLGDLNVPYEVLSELRGELPA